MIAVLLAALLLVPGVPAQQDYDQRAPFTDCRWVSGVMEVEVDGRWAVLLALDGIEAARLQAFAQERYAAAWQKRLAEDLVQVLTEMGQPPDATVEMVLRDPASGRETTLREAPMTAANRRRAWNARRRREFNRRERPIELLPPRRVARKHAAGTPAALRYLQKRITADNDWARAPLTPQAATQDLNELEWFLEDRYAYLGLRGVDYRAALDAVRAGVGTGISRGAFALQLAKVLALFGDAHTRLRVPAEELLPDGCLPFLVAAAGERRVAFLPGRSGFLLPDFPYLVQLDGRPLAEWEQAAAQLVPQGAPQFRRRQAARNLRYLNWLRQELGLPLRDKVVVSLADEQGQTVELFVPVAERRPLYGSWPRQPSRFLGQRFGYLRLASMDSGAAFLGELHARMQDFRRTAGLVIDLRGNGGGTRHALRALLPYFLDPAGAPAVVNVAAYRLPRGTRRGVAEGYLDNRFLFPAAAPLWTPAEREAIAALAGRFRPAWLPPPGDFSAWHYMVVAPVQAPPVYRYQAPVVLLMDAGCFSATDVFLGAFRGRPGITLLGTPSGGGSGRPRAVSLHHSGIELTLSSMASFLADGSLVEGQGVAPDVPAAPQPADFIEGSDSVLEAALALLRERARLERGGPEDR